MTKNLRTEAIALLKAQGFNEAVAAAATDTIMELFVAAKPEELQQRTYSNGIYSVDTIMKEIRVNGARIKTTKNEYRLAEFFIKHPGEMHSPNKILSKVWGHAYDEDNNYVSYVRVCVSNLRKKFGQDFIKTKGWEGYYMEKFL